MFIDIHTQQKESKADLSIFNTIISKDTQVESFNSVGGHPWYLRGFKVSDLIESINNNTLAIGACGLDKLRGIPIDKQLEIFEKHIFMAKNLKLPMIIHCMRAFSELTFAIENNNCSQPIIIHGFSRSPHFAQQLIEKDYYLSFGADLLTMPQSKNAFKVAYEANRFFLETAKWEGDIQDIYNIAAKIVRKKVSEVQERCTENFQLVFKKDPKELIEEQD